MRKPRPNHENGNFIFLSYPHKIDDLAYKYIEALQKEGYRVWFDTGLQLGEDYNAMIATKIEECQIFLALLTKEYYESKYCRKELIYAYEKCDQKVVPVYLGNPRDIKKLMPRNRLTGIHAMQESSEWFFLHTHIGGVQ